MIIALKFLNRDYDDYSTLHMMSLQYLNYASRDTMLFLMSSILQALRTYTNNKVEDFLVQISTKWPSLTHGIIWMAEVETEPGEIGKSARKVPLGREDTLPDTCRRIMERIKNRLRKHEKHFFETESKFFEDVTYISSILKPKMPKDEKKRIIKRELIKLNQNIPENVYLPTNPSCIVQSIVTTSGNPMQSAAKWPILVAFKVIENNAPKVQTTEFNPDEETKTVFSDKNNIFESFGSNTSGVAKSDSNNMLVKNSENPEIFEKVFGSHKSFIRISTERIVKRNKTEVEKGGLASDGNLISNNEPEFFGAKRLRTTVSRPNVSSRPDKNTSNSQKPRVVACIFKVFDDIRQDILALQICKLFKDIYKVFELDLYLAPYNVLCNRTGEERNIGGIIECVPNCKSRDELGKDYDITMYQYFLEMFGNPESKTFLKAQQNFIRSLAGYAVFSYIVQPKDRHNGNIMVDNDGHIVHIDFGFIFDWSPGGDIRFESAHFKFTNEMIKILGGNKKWDAYQLFVTKTIQGFLAVRKFATQIADLVYFAYHSGLPCFKTKSMKLLRKRFMSELPDCEAADKMRKIINDAHNKWTTNGYDWIQYMQQKIAY